MGLRPAIESTSTACPDFRQQPGIARTTGPNSFLTLEIGDNMRVNMALVLEERTHVFCNGRKSVLRLEIGDEAL